MSVRGQRPARPRSEGLVSDRARHIQWLKEQQQAGEACTLAGHAPQEQATSPPSRSSRISPPGAARLAQALSLSGQQLADQHTPNWATQSMPATPHRLERDAHWLEGEGGSGSKGIHWLEGEAGPGSKDTSTEQGVGQSLYAHLEQLVNGGSTGSHAQNKPQNGLTNGHTTHPINCSETEEEPNGHHTAAQNGFLPENGSRAVLNPGQQPGEPGGLQRSTGNGNLAENGSKAVLNPCQQPTGFSSQRAARESSQGGKDPKNAHCVEPKSFGSCILVAEENGLLTAGLPKEGSAALSATASMEEAALEMLANEAGSDASSPSASQEACCTMPTTASFSVSNAASPAESPAASCAGHPEAGSSASIGTMYGTSAAAQADDASRRAEDRTPEPSEASSLATDETAETAAADRGSETGSSAAHSMLAHTGHSENGGASEMPAVATASTAQAAHGVLASETSGSKLRNAIAMETPSREQCPAYRLRQNPHGKASAGQPSSPLIARYREPQASQAEGALPPPPASLAERLQQHELQRLRKKLKETQVDAERLAALENACARLSEDNVRLQSKLIKLGERNQERNVELEAEVRRLRAENVLLDLDNVQLLDHLDLHSSNRSTPSPGLSADEEYDIMKDVFGLVEECRMQIRQLQDENDQLKAQVASSRIV